ncbi:MAG: hypothetical protein V4629_13110 [Pseudomonadota bacterium]
MNLYFRTALLPAVALLVSTFYTPIVSAAPAVTEVWKIRGHDVNASWSTNTECVYESVYISASEFASRTRVNKANSTVESTTAWLSYSKSNICDGTWSYGWGTSDNAQLAISQNKNATLKTTIIVNEQDSIGNPVAHSVEVNLNFVAGTTSYSGHSISRYESPLGRSVYRSKGTYRDAVSTGTIKVDGVLDLISGKSEFGNISSNNSGSVSRVNY